jgi:hypothetical protein
MKNIKIGLAIGMLALTAFTSCKKLELTPFTAIPTEDAFKTVRDAQTWNNGIYAFLRGRQYGAYTITQDVQADQLNASLAYGNRNGAPHRWGDSFQAGETTDKWSAYYSAIANINLIIQGYTTITPNTAAETASLNKYKGDAYLARAYYYHQLALRFCKAYNPTTATTDLGLPLVLTYINPIYAELPSRATLKATFDQILADIAIAKPLLSSTAGVQGAVSFNIDVANALEARILLDMQDWTGAYNLSNALIVGNKYPLLNTAAALKAYWHTDTRQESILQLFTSTAAGEGVNTNSIYLGFTVGTGGAANYFTPDFIPTKKILDTYADNDFRKAIYFEPKRVIIENITYNNTIQLVNKYPGNPALFTSTNTNYAHAPKVFRIAEQYLIAAEAAANGGNPSNALTALNALRVSRGLEALVGLTGTPLTQAIRDERTRELAFEGFRLFDMKRWGLGFTGREAQNVNVINTGANFNLLTIDAANPKFTWGLPPSEITINSNLTQNPGW